MKRIQILDYARLAAALVVLLYHYTYNGILHGKVVSLTLNEGITFFTRYGHLGVQFFFMISGYVIFFSAKNRSAAKFASSRARRLYPAYWIAIIFTSIFASRFGGELMGVSGSKIAANFTLFQDVLGFGNVDGVYWTLFYEVRFYLVVFLLLLFGMQRWLTHILMMWPFMVFVGQLLGVNNYNLLCTPHYYYFASGALFAMLSEKVSIARFVSLSFAFVMCLWETSNGLTSIPCIAIVLLFFVFFALLNIPKIRDMNLPCSEVCGSLTYPVYLIHAHFGYMMLNQFANDENKWTVSCILVAMVFFVAWLIHYFVEVRMSYVWKRVFLFLVEQPVEKLVELFGQAACRIKQISKWCCEEGE